MTRRYGVLSVKGFEQLTVSSSAVGFDSAKAKPSNFAFITCQDANVRWRDDGTDPTAAVGMILNAGETLLYDGSLTAIKFIRKDASDAKLNISYYKE